MSVKHKQASMDFQIPEWDNESFSYHFTSSLDQTIIDTAISNAGDERKKHRKKPKTVDNTSSSNKKQKPIQGNCETPKTSITVAQSSKDANEVNRKVKLRKKQKLKTDVEKHPSIQKNNSSIADSNENQNFNLDTNDNVFIDKSLPSKNIKSKKNKKSGKHNKYKELNEKQKLEKNKGMTTSDKGQNIPLLKTSNSTMEWTVSEVIDSEKKKQKVYSTLNDSPKSNFVSGVVTNENNKNRKKNRMEKESIEIFNSNDTEILVSETSEICNQTVSKRPIVKNENNENKNQTEANTIKKRKKKKNKKKAVTGEEENIQEKVEVSGSISDVSKKQLKRNERNRKDVDNIEYNKLAKETDGKPNETKKKRKKTAKNNSEEENPKKKKKRKSMNVSYEGDLEIFEDKNGISEDSDLKAELKRYLGKLKSMSNDELFADDSEDEKIIDGIDNERDDEWESLEEDDEPGEDLQDSGDMEEEMCDNMKESNDEIDDDINSKMDGQETDSLEIKNVNSKHDCRNNLDDVEDDNDRDDNEDENETDMDSSESEEASEREFTEDNQGTSILVKNKDKKKKFDSEKLSALLQESESIKIPPKKNSPAEVLRKKMSTQLNSARFRLINEQLYTSTGDDAKEMFRKDPEAFQVYHDGYKSQVAKWPINPLDLIIKWLKTKPAELVVADFGCGEAKLCYSVPQKKVFSLDLQATCEGVIVCDMADTPLKTASVDIAVFCLSLMGTNINDYVCEANRVLKQEGILKIAEVESRFTGDINTFTKVLEKYGFKCIAKDTSHKYFFVFEFKKIWVPKKSFSLPEISLKPCIYKKR